MSAGPTRLRPRPPSPGPAGAGGDDRPTLSGGPDRRFRARRRWLRVRRWLRWVVPVVLVALLAGAAWLVLASPVLAVTTVQVSGTHRLTTAQIQKAAAIDVGQPMVRLDVGAVERRVEQLPVVKSAVVTRSWPHTVTVTVVERVPVASAVTTDGSWALVAADGVVLSTQSGRPTGLVLIDVDPLTVPPDTLRATAAVAAALPAGLRAKVRDVAADSPDSVRLDLFDGGLVRWGSAQDNATKARVLAVLLPHHAKVYDVTAPGFATTS